MKRGWKIFWITCAVTAAVGFVCCMVGVAMGATARAVKGHFPYGIGFIERENVDIGHYYSYGETVQDVDTEETFTNVHEIDMDVTALCIQVLESDLEDNQVKIETKNIDRRLKLNYYMDGGELKIESVKKLSKLVNMSRGTLWIYVPKGSLGEVSLEAGAGELYIQNITAGSLSVDIGAGEAVIDNFKAREVDFKCGAGAITATGTFDGEADIECGVGEIDLTVPGTETDYNYNIECGIGDVGIGGAYYSGLGMKKEIYNAAHKEMHVKCGIGAVTVGFAESIGH